MPSNKFNNSLVNAYGQNHEWNSLVIKFPLQSENNMVMEEAMDERILLEDKLSAEEHRRGESLYNFRSDFHNLVDDIDADFGNAFGVKTVAFHKIDVSAHLVFSL